MSKIKHGHCRRSCHGPRLTTPEWRSYCAMRTRCLNKNALRYADYGGRGVTICDRWLNGENGRTGFECFLADMGFRPFPRATLDRIDNGRGYEPGNCRWATAKEQGRNTRANRYVSVDGSRISFVEAVERYGVVSYSTAIMRVHRGWDDLRAITTPKQEQPFTPATASVTFLSARSARAARTSTPPSSKPSRSKTT